MNKVIVLFYRMKKFFHVLSKDKASSSANHEPSNTRHPIEPQPEVIPNSTNEGIKVVDYEMLDTNLGLRPSISSYHPDIQAFCLKTLIL